MAVSPALHERIGRKAILRAQSFAYAMGFFYEILKETVNYLRQTRSRRVLTFQILFTGVEALTVIAVLALALGAIIIIQGVSLLPQFGQGSLIYTILITVITRELGPILTAFIVTARSGTAIATELGNMVINHEIEAYVATGINPINYLVVPRFIGVTVSVVLLNLYFNIFGLLGSYFLTQFVQAVGFVDYFSNLLGALSLVDVVSSLIKSVVFGAIISTVATYYGFKVERSSTEVPQTAIKSVGQGFMLLIVANAILTLVYYV
jgi:phospholipid/cholesterol/gamma-HCH transport system permease protein